jgi:hypothetical protein
MGHAKKHKYYKQNFSIFIAKLQTVFQFSPGWYRAGEVREIVLHYYYVLRSVLRANSHLRGCLSRCRHCRIFFITHPRNAGREDLGCPFGCRQTHRKASSKKRSAEYYRSKEGKEKKKEHNRRRRLQTASADKSEDLVNEKPAGQGGEIIKDQEKIIRDKVTLSYIQMVVSFIEGRLVRFGEILQMLSEIVRQHSIGKRRRFVYAFTYPSQKPP